MLARIYQPARNAMQSGQGKTKTWVLEFDPAQARQTDPLMGWTSSADMPSQVKLTFDSKDAAIAYAEKHGLPYQTFEPKERAHVIRKAGYGDNFAYQRRMPWTH